MASTVLQFDPASLAFWVGLRGSSNVDKNEILSFASNSAILGRIDDLQDLHRLMAEYPRSDIALENQVLGSVSSVWHECRHFVDLVLTNFGGFKTRRYGMIYANLATLLRKLTDENGTLHCPVRDYLNPVQRRLYGLAEPPEDVKTVLRDINQRSDMIDDDRATISTQLGRVEVGGTGQLEVMAFICQSVGLQAVFGPAAAMDALASFPNSDSALGDYLWVMALQEIGVVSVDTMELERGLSVNLVNSEPVLALFLGALATRHWGQQQQRDHNGGTGFPAERLFGLARMLGPVWRAERPDAQTAWQQVNDACRSLWGRTALDEMSIDLRFQEQFIDRLVEAGNQPSAATRWQADTLRLRRDLFQMLLDDPGLFVSPERFPQLMSRLRVPVVTTYPEGAAEMLPKHGTVLGYRHEPSGAQWTWASAFDFTALKDRVGLEDCDAWKRVVSFDAPIAKLMLNGRRQQLVVGPEILVAERQLAVQGIELTYRKPYDLPSDSPDTGIFWFFRDADTTICDWCRETVPRGEGADVSPWLFRLYEPLGQQAILHMSDDPDIGYERFLRNWSSWLVCNRCRDLLADNVPGRYRHLVKEGH